MGYLLTSCMAGYIATLNKVCHPILSYIARTRGTSTGTLYTGCLILLTLINKCVLFQVASTHRIIFVFNKIKVLVCCFTVVVYMYGNLNLLFGHLLVHQSFYAPVDPTILCVVSSGKKCLAD